MTQWTTCLTAGGDTRVGVVEGDTISLAEPGVHMIDVITSGGLACPSDALLRGERVAVSDVRILPPVTSPPAVRDFMAFEQHARAGFERMGYELPSIYHERPVFYFTNPRALIGAHDPVPLPPSCMRLDFELEIAAVVGRECSDVSPEEGEEAIAGYAIFVDWSARDIQAEEMPIRLGPVKSKDTASTLGPWLVTPDELEDRRIGKAFDLRLSVSVNGQPYGIDSLANIGWSFGDMVSYASQGTTLSVGDVMGSGTCGNGCLLELQYRGSEHEFPWLRPGDVVEIEVDRLGRTANRIVETSARPRWPFPLAGASTI